MCALMMSKTENSLKLFDLKFKWKSHSMLSFDLFSMSSECISRSYSLSLQVCTVAACVCKNICQTRGAGGFVKFLLLCFMCVSFTIKVAVFWPRTKETH